jgi:hypothetical protein
MEPFDGLPWPGRYNEELGRGGRLGPAKDRGGDISGSGLDVCFLKALGERHAEGTHRDMHSVRCQCREGVSSKEDLLNRAVIGQHCDEHLTATGLRRRIGDVRTLRLQRLRAAASPVVNRDRVTRLEEVARHGLAHVA